MASYCLRYTIEVMALSPSTHSALTDLSALSVRDLLAALMSADDIAAHVARSLAEDLGTAGDVTGQAMISADARATAVVRFRSPGIACGAPLVAEVLRQIAPGARLAHHAADGEQLAAGATFISIEGPLRGILTAERTLLNYVGHLSGIATLTAQYVEQARGDACMHLRYPQDRSWHAHAGEVGGAMRWRNEPPHWAL